MFIPQPLEEQITEPSIVVIRPRWRYLENTLKAEQSPHAEGFLEIIKELVKGAKDAEQQFPHAEGLSFKAYPLNNGLLVGRGNHCQIKIDSPLVLPDHLRITQDPDFPDDYLATDLGFENFVGMTNGTLLYEPQTGAKTPLVPNTPTRIKHNQSLFIVHPNIAVLHFIDPLKDITKTLEKEK